MNHWDTDSIPTRWRPSIHMPRWASGITLEITGVRVEQVQDISIDDAYAEGITEEQAVECWYDGPNPDFAFSVLWDSINAKRGYPWSADELPDNWPEGKPLYGNPWVWVVEFKRVNA